MTPALHMTPCFINATEVYCWVVPVAIALETLQIATDE